MCWIFGAAGELVVADFEHLQSELIGISLCKEDGMFSTGLKTGGVKEVRV